MLLPESRNYILVEPGSNLGGFQVVEHFWRQIRVECKRDYFFACYRMIKTAMVGGPSCRRGYRE